MGTAPILIIVDTEAIKVRDVTITSSPGLISRDFNARSKANVPLAIDIA